MRKLDICGVRGLAYPWISNYLEKIYQYLQLNDEKSDLLRVTCGVPQGSMEKEIQISKRWFDNQTKIKIDNFEN